MGEWGDSIAMKLTRAGPHDPPTCIWSVNESECTLNHDPWLYSPYMTSKTDKIRRMSGCISVTERI